MVPTPRYPRVSTVGSVKPRLHCRPDSNAQSSDILYAGGLRANLTARAIPDVFGVEEDGLNGAAHYNTPGRAGGCDVCHLEDDYIPPYGISRLVLGAHNLSRQIVYNVGDGFNTRATSALSFAFSKPIYNTTSSGKLPTLAGLNMCNCCLLIGRHTR